MRGYTNLQDVLESTEYAYFIESKLGNDLFINDPERAQRMHDYAEDGCDGSTHQEVINDWRDYLDTLTIFDPDWHEDSDKARCDITQSVYDAITAEINSAESDLERKGILFSVIG
jgi:hypothetical protein